MRRAFVLAILLMVSATLLHAQRAGGGFHGSAAPAGSSYVAAPHNSAVHSSSSHGYQTEITAGFFPGRFGESVRGRRPYRYGYGIGWLPWYSPYWDDDFFQDESSYLQPVNAPPQAAPPVVVVDNKEPARPAPPPEGPKLVEVPLSKQAPPAKPQPPTVFVLNDGEKLESRDYLLTVSSLQIEVGREQRIIPVSKLNIDATLAADHERGIDLTFPRNSGTIFLGF